MHGFFLIDKEKGRTSFSCVAALRKLCDVRRVGFAGTLDPLATGLMIVAVGEATKLLSFLDDADKVYEAMVHFGAESNTYDAEGKITEILNEDEEAVKKFSAPTEDEVRSVLKKHFSGEVMQMPPVFSALKVAGKRAYDLARRGEKVELKARKVTFFVVEVVEYEWPRLVVRVHCSKGTYIRSFAHDLGRLLGCGGYVENLRRLKVGEHAVEDAVKLADLLQENIFSAKVDVDKFFVHNQRIDLTEADARMLANGGFVSLEPYNIEYPGDELTKRNPMFGIYKGKVSCTLEVYNGQLKMQRKLLIV